MSVSKSSNPYFFEYHGGGGPNMAAAAEQYYPPGGLPYRQVRQIKLVSFFSVIRARKRCRS